LIICVLNNLWKFGWNYHHLETALCFRAMMLKSLALMPTSLYIWSTHTVFLHRISETNAKAICILIFLVTVILISFLLLLRESCFTYNKKIQLITPLRRPWDTSAHAQLAYISRRFVQILQKWETYTSQCWLVANHMSTTM
jgi:hypothetical protein